MKELILARQTFAEELAKLINGSGLPAFVMAEILKNAFEGVNQLAEVQLKQALEKGESDGERISDD